ncbi:hypothetical protein [Asinibacterium sp. OR53]|jgi:hypothetical protein|uniref:hypothetical protein n=1 Tax=Asinibacterium sp. OR53 TaxID=925409 RepID=UPI0004789F48|nr:hypothetical protein [Asinibacterium sp. OR53]
MSGVYHWFTRLSVRHKTLLLLAIGLLLAGLINYYLFQPQILFFEPFHPVRRSLNDHSFLQLFLIGYFSDAAWCSALMLVTVVLSEHRLLYFRNKLLILLLPFAIEAAQGFGLLKGTFDWYDLLTYGSVECASIILFPSLIFPLYEKK